MRSTLTTTAGSLFTDTKTETTISTFIRWRIRLAMMFQIGTVIQTKNASLPRNASFKLANISCTKAT